MKVFIFFSGGKDSQASLIWAVNKYGVDKCEAVFCDTGWENPQTIEHINFTAELMGVKLTVIKSKKYNGMLDLAKQKGRFPSTKARFCTEELKTKPAIDYILSHSENLIVIEGIRSNESLSRSLLNKECTYFKYYFEKKINGKLESYRKHDVLKWCKKHNADKIRPIFDWTAEKTLVYILENGQNPNPLYYQGFKRVGCFPCIMENHSGLKLIIENHPEQWNAVKDAEKEVGGSFLKIDSIPKHAMKNKKYATAEDIETYLKNKNATLDIFKTDTPGCMSAYNLCE